jgi:hypothetical protein
MQKRNQEGGPLQEATIFEPVQMASRRIPCMLIGNVLHHNNRLRTYIVRLQQREEQFALQSIIKGIKSRKLAGRFAEPV